MIVRRVDGSSQACRLALVALFILHNVGSATAGAVNWSELKSQFAAHNLDAAVMARPVLLPSPFPVEVTVEGDIDIESAQLVILWIGLENFVGAEVGVMAADEYPGLRFVVASFSDRVELYRYSVSGGIENHAEVYASGFDGFLYSDTSGVESIYIPNEAPAGVNVTPCEVTIALGGIAQCALIGLAGPWWAIGCGAKWAIIGILADC